MSERRYRTIALAALAVYDLVLISGATVRVTGSGLGCKHWPGCQAGHPLPAKDYHSYIEFGNRVVSGLTLLFTLAVAGMAWLVPTTRRQRLLAVAIAVA
ncbi:MAG: heme a synthase, partial [Gaiellaceae bacterium]|nr:heme a synthase [Gaiellaceae bacterium]